MSDSILEDKLIEGTGTYRNYFPPLGIHKTGKIVPRIFPTTIRQKSHEIREKDVFIDGFEFIGTPVDESRLQKIRQENELSQNYGAVILPKNLLENIDPESSRFIVGEVNDSYIVAGLLPTKSLRWDARRVTSDEECIVYTLMSDFPTLDPQDLINKWAT